jgi:raffinose/stachyose/melibiose transport system permease protein
MILNNSRTIKTATIYKYILPILIVYCIAIIIPIFVCFGISLTSWKGGRNIPFVGLKNYRNVIKDKVFWSSILNNLRLIINMIIGQIGIAFIFSLIYSGKHVHFKEAHRRIIFLPAVLAPVVVGMIWQLIYRQDIGILAMFFRKIGQEKFILPWLDSPRLSLTAISITLVWKYVGQYVVIIMAGMQNIDKSVIEASSIDGAGTIKQALYVIFPMLKPTIMVLLVMVISGCMKMFDMVYIMTNGGPGTSSMVAVLYSYNQAFEVQKIGYGSATAIGVVIISLVLIILMRKVTSRMGNND